MSSSGLTLSANGERGINTPALASRGKRGGLLPWLIGGSRIRATVAGKYSTFATVLKLKAKVKWEVRTGKNNMFVSQKNSQRKSNCTQSNLDSFK
jgi:hypothetical protein